MSVRVSHEVPCSLRTCSGKAGTVTLEKLFGGSYVTTRDLAVRSILSSPTGRDLDASTRVPNPTGPEVSWLMLRTSPLPASSVCLLMSLTMSKTACGDAPTTVSQLYSKSTITLTSMSESGDFTSESTRRQIRLSEWGCAAMYSRRK